MRTITLVVRNEYSFLQENFGIYLNEYMSGCLDGTYKTPEYDLEDEIENANNAFQENLGYVPDIFSYPYGEYNLQIKDFIKEKFLFKFQNLE